MTDTKTDLCLYEVTDGVATLTWNRPERNNAWNADLERAYFDGLERARDDDDVRVIVITGAGKMFSPGADTNVLQGIESGSSGGEVTRRPQTFPLTIPKPLIAAINGSCAGISFCQTLMCDLRFAAAGAKFTTAFVRRGLVAEHGSSWLLPRLIGQARALDLLLSGRVFVAEEAEQLGVVNKVYPRETLLDEVLAYAKDVAANCSPRSMATIKAQVYSHLESSLDDAMDEANKLMSRSFRFPDFKEGVQSFVERRAPAFEPVPGDYEPIPGA